MENASVHKAPFLFRRGMGLFVWWRAMPQKTLPMSRLTKKWPPYAQPIQSIPQGVYRKLAGEAVEGFRVRKRKAVKKSRR
jgi:hypothetical protein